jgi:tRNA nucleotidyltransferase (CCA-adding enzyme)
VARRSHAYPQARVTAADLVDVAVAPAPAGGAAADALRLARKLDAGVLALATPAGSFVLREDLARAAALGLAHVPARALARPLPVVGASASEVAVRRARAGGAAAVVVDGPRGPLGAVARGAGEPLISAAVPLMRMLPDGVHAVLRAVGDVAAAHGARAFLVGGLVRDALRGTPVVAPELDIAVEGDGVVIARALAARLGGDVVEHARFLTASVEREDGRIDIATCRSERYETAGALPRVMPAGIAQDLRRRDFSVNAMGVELANGGDLLDPAGGRADLRRRRLRVLHPLSFVEDPTRILRGARYAARLGLGVDAWTARYRALAIRLAPYGALSGERLASELARVVADARPDVALRALGRAGAFRLLDTRYRFTRSAARALAALPGALAWAQAGGVAASALELAVLALVADQPPDVAAACLRRLAFTGAPLARLERARAEGAVGARLSAAASPAARARVLDDRSPLELAWLWLRSDDALRAGLDWFLGDARHVRASLRGDEVIALGVPRGPEVAGVLAGLRQARLDGRVADRAGETEYVRDWVRRRLAAGEEG